MTFARGSAKRASATALKTLILPSPSREIMPVETLSQLLRLQQRGTAVIYEGAPEDVPGLGRLAERRAQFHEVKNAIGLSGAMTGNITAELRRRGAVREPVTATGLRFIRRAGDSGHDYFFANLTDRAVDQWVPLGAPVHSAVIEDPQRQQAIADTLRRCIKAGTVPEQSYRRPSRKLRHFRIPTSVTFSEDRTNGRTMMEVVTTDRPGVLARIANAMRFCRVRLHNARIATFGERVEDIFFLTDMNNQLIDDQVKFECLRHSITEALKVD